MAGSTKLQAEDDDSDMEFEIELEAEGVRDGGEQNIIKDRASPEEPLNGRPPAAFPVADAETRGRFKAKLFALKNHRTKKNNSVNFAATANRSYNYEEIYEEDEYGKETFPEARVWRVYNDETQLMDQERIDAWRDALDVLLVFIGLFSAIVTTFVVQTAQALQPDYAQMTVVVALEILRTMSNSTSTGANFPFDTTKFGQAAPSQNDKLVNALWFTSLALSLSTALLTVVTKQWLYHYTTSTSGTSRERARIRQFRYAGLEAYRVPMIIDLLPVLLHLSLALFLVGLAIFLHPLHVVAFGLVVGIAGAAYLVYLASVILPLVNHQCPYKSPLSFYAYRAYGYCAQMLAHVWRSASPHLLGAVQSLKATVYPPTEIPLAVSSGATEKNPLPPQTLGAAEAYAVRRDGAQLDVDALVWLYDTSANSTVRAITLEAFGGLQVSDAHIGAVSLIIEADLLHAVRQHSSTSYQQQYPRHGSERQHDRLLRALCVSDGMKVDTGPLHSWMLRGQEKDVRAIFRSSVLSPHQSNEETIRLIAPFLPTGPQSDISFPLPVWKMVAQLVLQQLPANPVIVIGLLSALHLPIDASEIGAAKLAVGVQNPFIRALALKYLGIPDCTLKHVMPIFRSSASYLIAPRNKHTLDEIARLCCPVPYPSFPRLLSSLFSSLFQSLYAQTETDVSGQEAHVVRSILLDFFHSFNLDLMTWETLSDALDLCRPNEDTSRVCSVVSPPIIRGILKELRRRGFPSQEVSDSEHDLSWQLRGIFERCMEPESLDIAEAICTSLLDFDLLSSAESYWPPWAYATIAVGTDRLLETQKGQKWFEDWVAYIHDTARLTFICRQILNEAFWTPNPVCALANIQPANHNWPGSFLASLLLLHDTDYAGQLRDRNGLIDQHPRQSLSKRLAELKECLEGSHDLSDQRFDIPQFDENDDLISSSQSPTRDTSHQPIQNDSATGVFLPSTLSPFTTTSPDNLTRSSPSESYHDLALAGGEARRLEEEAAGLGLEHTSINIPRHATAAANNPGTDAYPGAHDRELLGIRPLQHQRSAASMAERGELLAPLKS